MNKINKWIKLHISKMITWFLLLGPIFDCTTALSIHYLHNSLTVIMFLKILFLCLLLYDFVFISKSRYKKQFAIILLLIGIYMIMFIGNILFYKDISVLFYECQNLLRTFFFPIALLCIYNLYLEKRFTPDCKYLQMVLMVYLFLILLPLLTHTGFDSYAYSKLGTIGWFYSTNEIGGILSILLPILLINLLKRKKIVLFIGLLIILFIYFSIGTKVPILSIMITFIIFGIYFLWNLIKNKKWKQISYLLITLIVAITSISFIIPKTSFYKNIQIHLDFLNVHSFSDLLTVEKIDHFIFSERIRFLENTMTNYQNSSFLEKMFGIGYIENYATDSVSTKLIEIDYYDVFFRHGIIGSILFFIPLLILLKNIYMKSKRQISISYLTSILLILLLSLFSGHILTAPSVSIIVSYILISYLKEDCYENRICNGQL